MEECRQARSAVPCRLKPERALYAHYKIAENGRRILDGFLPGRRPPAAAGPIAAAPQPTGRLAAEPIAARPQVCPGQR